MYYPVEFKQIHGFERAFTPHFHPEYSLIIVRQGRSKARIGNRTYAVKAGDFLVIPPFMVHCCNPEHLGLWSYDLLLLKDFSSEKDPYDFILDAAKMRPLKQVFLHQTCPKCEELFKRAGHKKNTDALLKHLAEAHRCFLNPQTPQELEADFTSSLEYLKQTFVQAPSLSDLAQKAGLSSTQYIRRFHKFFGISPHAWILNLKILHAKNLLRQGSSLSDTAYSCGFTDQSHFNRNFSKLVGLPPGEWQRKNRNFVQY